ncbi:MAG: antibiotic biosynthesis monooxygenase [Halieaceae bacterium]|jgi:quinol monooxygenase YgiN|nr:antibiotic biosynthesis monooxygenase [Halieaceae bacterium]MCP4467151.1 antibiotic biosynthesis monooxygenase [Halieaceae bacterium]MCP4840643.1 antibiotic biosynthesis monooxygenase [Halieaceae bacterium]MDG2412433.1 putative quinol monooxygenase [Halioglobus sp.]
MTILINGSLHLPAGEREKALAETAALVEETRSQKGCKHYVWSADPTSKTRVYVYENWDSVEDLAAHLAGPYYQNMLASLGKYGVSDTQVSKFKIALEEPVYDPEGKPRADFFTE